MFSVYMPNIWIFSDKQQTFSNFLNTNQSCRKRKWEVRRRQKPFLSYAQPEAPDPFVDGVFRIAHRTAADRKPAGNDGRRGERRPEAV